MARDYSKEYAARQAKAKSEGWNGYSQKRNTYEKINRTPSLRKLWTKSDDGKKASGKDSKALKVFHDAFMDKDSKYNRGKGSARATWFVEYDDDATIDYEEWEDQYSEA